MAVFVTQFISRREDSRAQARVVVGVGKGSEVVLQTTVSKVKCHQTSTHYQQQQEEDWYHH